MRKIRIFATALLLVLVIGLNVQASNNVIEITGNDDGIGTLVDDIMPQDGSYPTEKKVLAVGKSYNFSGNAEAYDLYTNYYFPGLNSTGIEVNNARSESLKVTLMRVSPRGLYYNVESYTVPANSTVYISKGNLDSDSGYFIMFKAPCKFSGYIKRVS